MAYRERQKISQMTPKGSDLEATDLVEVSVLQSGSYVTKSITGQEIINAAGGGGSGYVPYTGANQNVDLGTFHLDAGKGTFNHNGSTDTLIANHTSGSGIGLLITKGGANEGLKVNKTSGSGNAATIIGTLEATTIVKTGGLSTQFLMADGTTSLGGGSLTVGTTSISSGTIGRVLFQGAGNVLQQDAALFWDNTNKRLGIGATPSTSVPLDVRAQGTLSTDVAFRVRNSANTANLFDVQGDGVANVRTRMNCGFSGMTSTGGALQVFAGNNNDFISRWYNSTGVSIMSIRTVSDGSQLTLLNSSGIAGVTLDGQNSNAITIGDAKNIAFATSTGTKIGTATNQKFAFWNATPIVQPTTAVAAATLVGGGGTTITATDTFDGYTLQQIVKALRNTGLLA